MIEFIKWLKDFFSSFMPTNSEVYLLKNTTPRKQMSYPYLAYEYNTETLDAQNGRTGVFVDFSVFDNRGLDFERIDNIVDEIMRAFGDFENRYALQDGFLLRITNFSISTFDTGSDVLQRRNGQFYIEIDWRK